MIFCLLSKLKRLSAFLLFNCVMISVACSSANSGDGKTVSVDSDAFADYWYAGKAEITRYELNQARYGEIRKGDAVLIFVTEDFLKDKQVKRDFGSDENAVTVLKLNSVRKFNTGIYPYSIMTSVFTPVATEQLSTLKVSFSSQEWCGHVFTQLNNRGDHFDVLLRSYFQSEGDQNFELPSVLLEDEVWTKLRLKPDSLPTGDIRIIPGAQFTRLRHVPMEVEEATAKFNTEDNGEVRVYTIEYKNLKRRLVIKFEPAFPHRILGWEESYPSGFGSGAEMMTTTAVKTHSMKIDYWNKNANSHAHLREELGLEN